MTEQLATKQFSIEFATEADVSSIGRVHLQSMFETYPNREAGIDKGWIKQKLGFLIGSDSDEFRRRTVRQAETDPDHVLYLVVKNIRGQVVGFFHVSRNEQQAKLEAIYLTEEARGTGVGSQLIQRGLEFAGKLPMSLEVLDYNQRAIRLYEKYGFDEVPDSHKIIRDKLPVFTMQRNPAKETKS